MIIEYTRNPNASVDDKLKSLQDSVQLAFNEIANSLGISAEGGVTSNAFLAAHPPGSLYITVADDNPNSYGGEWEKLKDIFLFASGDKSAGEEGGEEFVTLTADQSGVPEHTHGMAHTHSHYHKFNNDRKVPGVADNATNWNAAKVASGSSTTKNYLNKDANDTLYNVVQTGTDATASSKSNTDSNTAAGAAEAHNNMPPYMVVNMWKRIA